ncbi:hypothetical protein F441_13402 [Phytophthora nicotianae CJ01A1]|uniref:Uncharacterized protein n=4 Tax=Phytophthora nicotianae TaxID=4792 RepID=V9EPX1_PHYNI|nr:hypothetical protein F443_13467 [Phytophthora nicotianae P1569]ETK81351.1 hypothetical protein L915_13155 [Phytophthora nicotianae]ETL34775.1 hypothetical protein L916_13046 [Phytophthora nicotianae]ETO69966.1 hypothetical protein F444_13528 [Phytophthora nicotianae P1976]ETP11051.1 hypothetical protein F441_13402 [Phytophthora nicotianae CJ01A1]
MGDDSCGSSECDWERYGGELQKTSAYLLSSLPRKSRHKYVRAALRHKYIYIKTAREELDGSKRGRWREALDCWDLRMWSRRPLASAVTRTYGTWICG